VLSAVSRGMYGSMYILRRQSLVELLLLIAGIGAHPRVALGQLPAAQGAPKAASDAQVAALVKQASARIAQGQLALAEMLLERARSLAPHNELVLKSLAKLQSRLGELPAAVDIFRQIVAAEPASPDAHLNLAIALADSGDQKEALEQATAAEELDPRLAAPHLNRARILDDLHRPEEAKPEFETACHLAPTNGDCYFYWALLEREEGDYARESSLLERVVSLQPHNDKAYYLLGRSYAYQSLPEKAVQAWRKALALNPNYKEAAYSLARAMRKSNPAAARIYEQRFNAIRENGDRVEQVKLLGNQAVAAMSREDWPGAIVIFRQALTLCGGCEVEADLHKDMGLALCHAGEIEEGTKELHIALSLDSGNLDVVKALQIVEPR
jgi:tetratricopeptide (TPR) repeat protein